MPNVLILLNTPDLPVIETRDFDKTPAIGEHVHVKAYNGIASYKVIEVVYPIKNEAGNTPQGDPRPDAVIVLQATKQEATQPTSSKNISFVEEWKRVFEQSTAYNNVMMIAGYAGIFAVWSLINKDLDKFYSGIAATLVGSSLLIFVLFELIGMWGQGLRIRSNIDTSSSGSSLGKSLLSFKEKSWIVAFPITSILSLAAASLLFWRTFVDMLFK